MLNNRVKKPQIMTDYKLFLFLDAFMYSVHFTEHENYVI